MAIIGIDLKSIALNYVQCEYDFKDNEVNKNSKSVFNFFKNLHFNYDIVDDILRLKEEGNNIILYIPSYLKLDDEKLLNKLITYNYYDNDLYCDEIKVYNNMSSFSDIDMLVSNINLPYNAYPFELVTIDSANYSKNELIKKVRDADYISHKKVINKKENSIQKAITGIPSIDKPWKKFYSDKEKSIILPEMSMYDYLYSESKDRLNEVSIFYYDNEISYKELFDNIDKYAKSFKSYGIKRGDIVSVCLPNIPEAIYIVYALNKIGAVANMIHPLKSPNEIKEFVNNTESKMLFILDTTLQTVEPIKDELCIKNNIVPISAGNSMPFPLKTLYETTKKLKLKNKYLGIKDFVNSGKYYGSVNSESYNKDEGAVIMYTGGTSGIQKPALLTNDNFNSMVYQQKVTAKDFKTGDVMLTIMPVFHGFGLCSSIHMPLSYGIPVVLWPKFESKKLKSMYEKYNVNHMFGVPKLFEKLIKNEVDLSDSGYLVSGGEKIEQKREEKINEELLNNGFKYKLKKGYGLTEAVAGTTLSDDYSNKLGSVGIPLVCNDFKVVKPGTDEELGYYEKGEFCISGPTVMKGYYKLEDETNNTLKKHKDGKIWLHTGDMGYMDEDGLLYYTDRLTRMYTSGGFNVYPPQIEEVILKLDEINACAVVPYYHPTKNIKVPKVYIILKQGITLNEELINKIKIICKRNLDKYHQPFDIEQIDEFPITNLGSEIGKIDYKELEERANEKVKVKKLVP